MGGKSVGNVKIKQTKGTCDIRVEWRAWKIASLIGSNFENISDTIVRVSIEDVAIQGKDLRPRGKKWRRFYDYSQLWGKGIWFGIDYFAVLRITELRKGKSLKKG